ncbi:GIY-YIG nuclease family protein [Halomonas caseinilytica]|uniref:GIY-YIG nuclease family protein n=1 Tax=Halomonas caseinilytica TaxID=438744 RepID=UPI0007E592B0|nr:GIY-YIG nuclease family protein [Halomonas caseinilytica]SEN66367.1 T5orf172 domain-containing protein [Halomonas caseinilytica]
MQPDNVINFPDRSSEDEDFAAFWEECKATAQRISYERAHWLFHAKPEEYFSRAGWVYVLGNQFLADDVYKVGRTTGRIERRMRQLYTTGVPGEFDCLDAWWFADCHHAEAFVHELLEDYRLDLSREFFCADLKVIKEALMMCSATGDPCPPHMVEQMLRRSRNAMDSETVRGAPLIEPSDLEVPF